MKLSIRFSVKNVDSMDSIERRSAQAGVEIRNAFVFVHGLVYFALAINVQTPAKNNLADKGTFRQKITMNAIV